MGLGRAERLSEQPAPARAARSRGRGAGSPAGLLGMPELLAVGRSRRRRRFRPLPRCLGSAGSRLRMQVELPVAGNGKDHVGNRSPAVRSRLPPAWRHTASIVSCVTLLRQRPAHPAVQEQAPDPRRQSRVKQLGERRLVTAPRRPPPSERHRWSSREARRSSRPQAEVVQPRWSAGAAGLFCCAPFHVRPPSPSG